MIKLYLIALEKQHTDIKKLNTCVKTLGIQLNRMSQ